MELRRWGQVEEMNVKNAAIVERLSAIVPESCRTIVRNRSRSCRTIVLNRSRKL